MDTSSFMSSSVHNTVIDVSTIIHIPVKALAMYVIYRHSPKSMGFLPFFILNAMIWNLASNIVAVLFRNSPVLPTGCFRIDGIPNVFGDKDLIVRIFIGMTSACMMNIGVALTLAFPYRYFAIAYPHFTRKIRSLWLIIFCFVLHVSFSVGAISVVPYEHRALKNELSLGYMVYCVHSIGTGRKALGLGAVHGAKKTIEWCDANLPGFWTKSVWPSNSPDLNPLDFAIWGILEQKACAIKHKSIDSLKRALEKAWEEITPEMIAAILKNFRKRLDACIEAEGGHFECS
ncbi:hypothetical protein QR680_015576 [Steinernema hermaphroditum]|uniref:Uncharacterized protein n=1 Tax=Steinernema hermaphroditum TaxID=289476 RepID=A0AA39H891_9BILA|nr:hypothetical protein QR680_015576 [Steinernema hermaphroditum]